MKTDEKYELIRVSGGGWSLRSKADGETFHPAIGPAAEAQLLYVNQLRLESALSAEKHHAMVVWDVGLGAAANALAAIQAARKAKVSLRIVSFDRTIEALEFALKNAQRLEYLNGCECWVRELISSGNLRIERDGSLLHWELRLGDFPKILSHPDSLPPPSAILFDPYSPSRNPEMWTQPLFASIYRRLDQPCILASYTRSTMIRTALLLAGFFVGAGEPTGAKDETTVASNRLDRIEKPLSWRWLERARRSSSAEPLWEANYRQVRLTPPSWEKLIQHPQFVGLHSRVGTTARPA